MKTFFIVLIDAGENEDLAIEIAEETGDFDDIIEVSDDLYKKLGFNDSNIESIVSLGDWPEDVVTDLVLKDEFDSLFDRAEYLDKYPYALIR